VIVFVQVLNFMYVRMKTEHNLTLKLKAVRLLQRSRPTYTKLAVYTPTPVRTNISNPALVFGVL